MREVVWDACAGWIGAVLGQAEVRWSWGGVGEAQFNVGLGIGSHVGAVTET